MHPFRLAVVAVAAAVFAGCLDDTQKPGPTVVFEDAQARFENRVDGAEDVTREFSVPEGKGKLVVFAQYRVDGAGAFKLKDSEGQERHKEEISGSKTVNASKWVEIENPPAGVWHLEIEIAGSGQYIFGIYLSGVAPPPAPPLYEDAKVRAANKVNGADSTEKKFDVPPGTEKITVKAKYHVDGAASFTLWDAATIKEDDGISGSKDFKDGVWYEATNPIPGPWRLNLQVSGSADYTFGIYY